MPLSVRAVTREHIEAFIEDHVARLRPASAGTRYRSLQQYWRWLADDGELDEVSEFRHRDRSRA
jgi:hypothetical protein